MTPKEKKTLKYFQKELASHEYDKMKFIDEGYYAMGWDDETDSIRWWSVFDLEVAEYNQRLSDINTEIEYYKNEISKIEERKHLLLCPKCAVRNGVKILVYPFPAE